MTTVIWILITAAGLYALHRTAVRMEDRGWIYYRKSRGSTGALGSAFLEVQSMLEPGTRHVIEARRREEADEKESGDPPEPGV
jgi:hypothetical protein